MSKKFTHEFKLEALKLVNEQKLSTQQVSADLGIGKSTLERWVSQHTPNHNATTNVSECEKEE